MKTGVIVYITGAIDGPVANLKHALRQRGIIADRIEVISRNAEHFDLADAWWALTAKGVHRVICFMGELTSQGDVRLTNRELRLCG